MPVHNAAFYAALFFILGIALGSFTAGLAGRYFLVAVFVLVTGVALYFLNKKHLAALAIFMLIGCGYYFADDAGAKSAEIIYNRDVSFEGVVRKSELTENGQDIFVGNIKLYAGRYPSYEYGDRLSLQGKIQEPQEEYKNYFLKDGILGTMRNPKIILVGINAGNPIKASLLKIKSKAENTFKALLPYDEALFLGGLVLGSKADYSREFRETLSRSGTTHLVALSGYNISVIAKGVAFFFALVFSRSATFFISLIFIFLFVIMTGAEASVTRAGFMGAIALLANQTGRVYSFKNAAVIAALFMLLENPKILVFDLGFQLSFAALLGIVYLEPVIGKVFRLKREPGFLAWRENFKTTLAAQLAVFPILIMKFGVVSLSGIVSNILILGLIPWTMFFGFLMGIFGFISHYLSWLLGFIVAPILSYELMIIEFFSKFGYFSEINLSISFAIIYYVILFIVIAHVKRREVLEIGKI